MAGVRAQLAQPYRRSASTWLAYCMLGCFAFLEAVLGPLVSFLQADLRLNYTVVSLHGSAFALGSVLVGLAGERFIRRWGRRASFWGGVVGMAAGAVLLSVGRHALATITAALVMGSFGALVLVTIGASLSDEHGEQRTVALTEANVVASISAILASLSVGLLAGSRLGWRAVPLVAVAGIGLLTLIFARAPLIQARHTEQEAAATRAPLPAHFWFSWLVLVLGVTVEWSVVSWGALFLERGVGLPRAVAAGMMGLFFLAMLIGRVAGSRLARQFAGSGLLLGAFALALAGFPLFWLGPLVPLHILGLVVVGLGVANAWPVAVAVATSAAARQVDTANARLALGGGGAGLVAPLSLGALADRVSLERAFGVIGVLLVLAIVATMVANRSVRSRM